VSSALRVTTGANRITDVVLNARTLGAVVADVTVGVRTTGGGVAVFLTPKHTAPVEGISSHPTVAEADRLMVLSPA